MKKKRVVLLVALLGVMLLPAINLRQAFAEREVIVSAAASLTNAFRQIGEGFEAANPGVRIVTNFASSGALLRQIEMGAPVDVFASADQKTMDQAEEMKLIQAGTRKDFVSNKLVLIVPPESKTTLESPRDLTRNEFTRISLGNPDTVPAGRYAREVLSSAGTWETLQPRFVYGESVRQVLDYVSRGEVEAGFVFSTDAAIARDKVRVAASMAGHTPIKYPIAVVAGTRDAELSRRFIEYVLGNEGREILAKYGFGMP